ncbi:N-terminal glutamine amidase-domain-containing protein [Choanephora cucurbitarum]|nr:N-terminal glutamine amidase-domain-containing protein [Choanephora cucurbitarum]
MTLTEDQSLDVLKFKQAELNYTANYCEENIYKLCEEIQTKRPDLLEYFHVVFISNKNRMVPLWQQRAGREEDHMVVWDYHVVLYFEKEGEKALVYDFDTLLPFPTPADVYATNTFKPHLVFNDRYHHAFRLIPAKVYLESFQSDRSHMLKEDGCYIAQPPSYPIISKGQHNLDEFISMESCLYGNVFSNNQFYDRLFNTLG